MIYHRAENHLECDRMCLVVCHVYVYFCYSPLCLSRNTDIKGHLDQLDVPPLAQLPYAPPNSSLLMLIALKISNTPPPQDGVNTVSTRVQENKWLQVVGGVSVHHVCMALFALWILLYIGVLI